jgi:hypothetical protein
MIELGLGPQLESVRGQFPLNDGSGRARIDGLLAAQTFKAHPPAGALAAIAERLDQLTDAVGDLLLAEAVHHQVSGRPNLAQAALSGLDTGVSLPSDFEVVRTDSDSTTRAWHIILPLAPEQVNAWAAGLIGESSRWSASVRSASGGAATTITYAQLNVAPQTLLDFVKTGPSAPALAGLFEQAAGGGIATFSAELQTALRVADAISRLLRSAKPLEDSDVSTGRDAIPELAQRSRQTEWLHDLGRVRTCIDALDSLAYIARANGIDLKLRFLASGPRLNLLSIGDLPAASVTTGSILDAWNDTTPGTETVTGIAMHYDAPRSRAPQAVLLMVPPDPAARWSIDTVAAILLETADLTQIRMVRPADVHGSFLPAVYIADNLAAETVSTDFFPFAYVTEWKDASS